MKLIIISGCSSKKSVKHPDALKIEDFIKGQAHIAARERQLYFYMKTASKMYIGQEHNSLRLSISTFYNIAKENGFIWDIKWRILSAGYGFISPEKLIAPYDCSFHLANHRAILKKFNPIIRTGQNILKKPYDLCIIALGYKYFAACDFLTSMKFGGPTICFCNHDSFKKISVKQHQNLKLILSGGDQSEMSGTSDNMTKAFFIEKLLYELSLPGTNVNQFISQLIKSVGIERMLNSVQLSQAWEDKKKEIKKLL